MKLQILNVTLEGYTKNDPFGMFSTTAYEIDDGILGHPYWVKYIRPYFQEIGVDIVVDSFYNLDLSKPWFICLAPSGWNWNNFRGDILDIFFPHLAKELLYGNAYLIVNHECEAITDWFFVELHKVIHSTSLSPSKILYMNCSANAHEIYQEFVSANNIPKDKHINLISTHHVWKRMKWEIYDLEYDRTVPKEKKFLSLNRVARRHRVMLVSLMAYYDLLDHGYVSLGLDQQDVNIAFNDLACIPLFKNNVDFIYAGFEKIRSLLPLQVDNIDIVNTNRSEMNSLPKEFYQKTYFSVVSSTSSLKEFEPSVGFTEKELKPIIYKHPFLVNNRPGALKYLRNMGFLTFGKWFDESYDEVVDDLERMHKMILEVRRLSLISDNEWNAMLAEMEPILLHNYNVLVNHNLPHVFFNSDLKDFLYYVK